MLFAAKCSAMLTVVHRKMYWRTHGSSAAARIRCGGQGTEAQRHNAVQVRRSRHRGGRARHGPQRRFTAGAAVKMSGPRIDGSRDGGDASPGAALGADNPLSRLRSILNRGVLQIPQLLPQLSPSSPSASSPPSSRLLTTSLQWDSLTKLTSALARPLSPSSPPAASAGAVAAAHTDSPLLACREFVAALAKIAERKPVPAKPKT